MINREARQLRDALLAEARERGVALEQESLSIEQNLPVLRLRVVGGVVLRSTRIRLPGVWGSGEPDVITVHGSGFRRSRMWPRKQDGTFNVGAIVDHLLALVDEELGRPKPRVRVATGATASASGVHIIHAAAVYLGTMSSDTTPDQLVHRVGDDRRRQKIKAHARRGGLADSDLRALSAAARMFFGRSMKFDSDPFDQISDRHVTVLRVGALKGGRVERRFVLVLDCHADKITVADPVGDGVVVMQRRKLDAAWKLGTTSDVLWLGTLGRDDTTEAW